MSCWGKNYFGQIGDGSTTDRKTPVSITALGTTVVELAIGTSHSCARHGNGSLSCWGHGFYGQIGDGSKVDRWFPVAVTGLGIGTTELASGGTHSCARRLDGSLWCWGNNWKGQLGTGSPRGTSVPTLALSLRCHCGDAVCSRSETAASCPVDCRGESYGDKKCTGAETEATHPNDCQRVAYGQLASGRWHSCALRPDGSLWCWGKNHLGQMGRHDALALHSDEDHGPRHGRQQLRPGCRPRLCDPGRQDRQVLG